MRHELSMLVHNETEGLSQPCIDRVIDKGNEHYSPVCYLSFQFCPLLSRKHIVTYRMWSRHRDRHQEMAAPRHVTTDTETLTLPWQQHRW